MNYQEFNDFCSSLKATTYVVQWGGAHVWKVGGKLFAVGGWAKDIEPDADPKSAYTFKVSEFNFHFLSDEPGYRPAPYLASRGMKWIQQFDGTDEDLRYYLEESHRIVSLGLTKKKQKELGLNQE